MTSPFSVVYLGFIGSDKILVILGFIGDGFCYNCDKVGCHIKIFKCLWLVSCTWGYELCFLSVYLKLYMKGTEGTLDVILIS